MIRSYRGVAPRIAATALVTPVADVLGDVLLEAGAVVLDGAVVEAGAEEQAHLAATAASWREYAAHFKATARPVPVT